MFFRPLLQKKRVIIITSFFAFSYAFFTVNNICPCNTSLYAQVSEDKNPPLSLAKSIRLVKNGESTVKISAKNSKGELLANTKVDVSVSNPGQVSVRVKDAGADDKVKEGSKGLITKTDGNGEKSFVIRGLKGGSSEVFIKVLKDGGNNSDAFTEIITVKTIELKVHGNSSW